jgi:hypothetical protein
VHHIKRNTIFRGYLLLFFIVFYEFKENIGGSMQNLTGIIQYIFIVFRISQIMKIYLFNYFFNNISNSNLLCAIF